MYATALVVLIEKYRLTEELTVGVLESLASVLTLRFDFQARTCRSLELIIKNFPDQKRFSFCLIIVSCLIYGFCLKCCTCFCSTHLH